MPDVDFYCFQQKMSFCPNQRLFWRILPAVKGLDFVELYDLSECVNEAFVLFVTLFNLVQQVPSFSWHCLSPFSVSSLISGENSIWLFQNKSMGKSENAQHTFQLGWSLDGEARLRIRGCVVLSALLD